MPLRQPDGDSAVSLSVRGLAVRRDGKPILDAINLSLPRGQRLALLGPPGAGKTALLLAVAGLLKPSEGTVLMDGRDVTRLRPAARGIGVAITLPPAGGWLAARRRRRLAPGPGHGLLLLDEPRAWPPPGATVLAAFADQAAALAGADRIAVLRDGRLVQEGIAATVYEHPRSAFVARFLGGANMIGGTVREVRPGRLVWVANGLRFQFVAPPDTPRPALGATLKLALRPERIVLLGADHPADNTAAGTVATATFLGHSVLLGVDTPIGRLDVRLAGARPADAPAPGAAVRLGWAADAALPMDED
jgi:ABC-type Fe3+/spermidine/putrescine transport system ATPase subunit